MKPTIWRDLNVSQPRPKDTIQIKRVRQVSIVERDVALTLRVTERPKKLNPLAEVESSVGDVDSYYSYAQTYPMLIMIRRLEIQILC